MADDKVKNAAGDADTGTGQQLKDLVTEYDKPDEQALAEHPGLPLLGLWAIKNGLESEGYHLGNPAPSVTKGGGWHNLGHGGVPPDWEELVRKHKLG